MSRLVIARSKGQAEQDRYRLRELAKTKTLIPRILIRIWVRLDELING